MARPETDPLSRRRKIALATVALIVLLLVYVFQRFNYYQFFLNLLGSESAPHPYTTFSVNRIIRLILNDTACLVLIRVLFYETKYLRLAGYIFIFELIILLPLYLWVKLTLEGDSEISSPLLSQVHRLIVNPMLMFLLMVAFFYQKRKEKEGST